MRAGMGFEEMMLSFLKSNDSAIEHREFIDTYVSGWQIENVPEEAIK